MKKRDFLKNSLILAGGTIISGGIVATTMSSCKADPVVEVFKPAFFNENQFAIIQRMIDLIIPSTDSADGALTVGCDRGIDQLVANTFKAKDKTKFTAALDAFAKNWKTSSGKAFLDADKKEQLEGLQNLEKIADETEAKESLIGTVKWLTYSSYFSTEYAQTEVLAFDPLPGNYDGCIDYSSVNNTWAE